MQNRLNCAAIGQTDRIEKSNPKRVWRRLRKSAARWSARGLLMLATMGTLLAPTAQAVTYYWDTTTIGTWAAGANWSDDPASGGVTGTVPLATDSAVFNQSTVNGNQTVQLDAPASIAGITFINTGTTLIEASAAGSQALTLGSGGITVNSGAGAVTIGGATNLVPITLDAAQSWLSNSANALTVANDVTNGGNLLTVGGTGATVINGIIGGSGGITLANSATLTLSATNLYTGNTTLAAGTTLNFNKSGAIGATAGTLIINGGTLDNTSGAAVTNANNNAQQWNGDFTFTGGTGTTHNLSLGTGAVTLNNNRIVTVDAGTLTVGGAISGSGFTLTKAGAGTLVLSGSIGTTTGGLAVTGGTLSVTGNTSTFTGNITVDGANSVLQMAGSNGSLTGAPLGFVSVATPAYKTITLTNGATFRPLATYNDNVPSATLPGNGYIFSIGTGGAFFDVGSGITFTVDDGTVAGTLTTSSQLQGSGAITKLGVGTMVLRNQQVFAGTWTIAAGTVQMTGASAWGTSGAGTTVQSGAAIDLNGQTATDAEPLTLNGTGLASNPRGALVNNHATNAATWIGPVTLGSNATIGTGAGNLTLSAAATIDLGANTLTTLNSGAGNVVVAGVISGAGAVNVTGTSTGYYVPQGANTYTGGTTLNPGSSTAVASNSVGAAGSPDSGPFGAGTAPLVLAGGNIRSTNSNSFSVANAVTLSADTTFLTATSEKTLTFTGPVTITGATRTLNSAVGTTVAGNTVNFNGAIGDGGNGFGITKTGAGNLTLGAANTYTGPTSVNAGTLTLTPTGSLASAVVNVGGAGTGGTLILQGSKTIGGADAVFTVAGNAVPANAGTLSFVDGTFNTLTISTSTPATPALVVGSATGGSANLSFEIGAAGGDQISLGAGAQATINSGGAFVTINALNGLYNGAPRVLLSSPTTDLTTTSGGLALVTNTGNWGGHVLSLTTTANAVTVTGVANPTPTTAWFKGNIDGNWSTFTGGAANNSNFTTDAAGTINATGAIGAATDLHFYATGATNLASSLGRDFTIKTLTVDATAGLAAPISIAPGTNPGSLTITPASSTTGITYEAGSTAAASLTISAPVVLGANQTWTNNALAPITVSGAVSGNANLVLSHATAGAGITISGAVNINGTITRDSSNAAAFDTISGVIGANVTAITQNNPNLTSSLIIQGANTAYAGTTTLNAGRLDAQNTTATNVINALGTGPVVLNGGVFDARANGSGSFQNIVAPNSITVGGDTTIDVQRTSANTNNSIQFNNLTIGANQLNVTGTNSYNLNIAGTTTLTGAATFNPTTAPLNLLGQVNNAGNNLIVSGTGATRLMNTATGAGANALTGTITVNGGALLAYAPAAGAVNAASNSLGTATIAMSGTNPVLRLAPSLDGGLTVAPTAGLFAKGYTGVTSLAGTNFMGAGNAVTAATGVYAYLNVPLGGGTINDIPVNTASTAFPATTAFQITGLLNITNPGVYTFSTATDDFGSLVIDGNAPIVSAVNTVSGTAYLTAGLHTFSYRAGNNGGNGTIGVRYQGPDAPTLVNIPASAFFQTSTSALAANFGNNISIAAGTNATIQAASNTTLGSLSTTGSGSGTTLNLLGTNDLTSISFTGGTLAADLAIANATANVNITGLGGSAGLTKAGGVGTLTLSGVNTYSGVTGMNVGTLAFNASNNLGDASATNSLAFAGGTLQLTGSSNSVNLGVNRSIALGTGGGTIDVPVTNTLEISGAITGTTALTKTGQGTLTLSGAGTSTGNTVVSNGIVNLTGSLTGNTTATTLAYGNSAARTIVNVSGNITAFATTGANNASAIAVYNQTAGNVTVSPGNGNAQYVANTGYGYFNLTGGTYRSTNRFDVNRQSATAVGVAYIGNTGTLNNNAGEWMIVAYGGLGQMTVGNGGSVTRVGATSPLGIMLDTVNAYGVLNVAGGTVDTGTQPIRFGNGGTNINNTTGFVNLASGTLSVGTNMTTTATGTGSNAYLNYAGGTLRSTATISGLIPANTASINFTSTIFGAVNNSAATGDASQNFTGGLTFDTNGFATTYSTPLLAAAGSGVTQADIAIPGTGNSGYIGAPAVQFSTTGMVAGGTPAAGYALISGGQVTGIVITSPGTYTAGSTPTITLTGGGGTIAPFATAALNTANTAAGVTKNGAGTLTLSGVNTYAGPTVINNGTLSLANTAAQTLAGNFTINAGTLNFANTGALNLSGSITGAGTITQTGAGTSTLTGNINVAQIIDSAGTIVITGATNLNSTPILVNGGIFDLGGTSQNAANFTLTSGSIINGTLTTTNFLKQGPGTLSLGNTNTVSTVTINQGLAGTTSNPASLSTVNLNFAAAGAPATNLFSSVATLTLGGPANSLVGGGALNLTGAAAGANSQTFASTLIDGGASASALTIGAGGTVALNLGTLTRNVKGTIDFTLPAGTQSATNGVIVGNPGTAGTLLTSATGTAYATVGGNDWAANSTVSAGNIVGASVAGAAGASLYTAYATDPVALTGHADITGTITAPSDQTFDSLRFNAAAGPFTLTLAGTNTINTGGMLFGSTSTGGTLTGGTIVPGAGQELVVIVNKANTQTYTLGSVFADGLSGPTTVTYRGQVNGGTTGSIITVNANNTYTGPTYITQGRVQVISTNPTITTPFGTGSNAIVYVDGNNDGQFFMTMNTTVANPFVIVGNGFNEAGTRRGVLRLDSTSSNTPTLSGPITLVGDATIGNNSAISGAGFSVISGNIGTSNAQGATSFALNKILTGIIKLSGTNSQTATNINAGILNINADAALGLTAAPVTFTGSSRLQLDGAVSLPATRSIVVNAGVQGMLDTNGFNVSVNSPISGAGTFAKGGAGTATLNVSPTTPVTTVMGGTLTFGADNLLGSTTLAIGDNSSATGAIDLGTTNQAVSTFSILSNSATANTVTIPTGKTLTINGNVSFGNVTSTGTGGQTVANFVGGGSLLVNAAAGTFNVGNNIGTTNNAARATISLAALGSFTASLGTGSLTVQNNGDNSGGAATSTLSLSNTANTITAANLNVGASATGAVQTLNLGLGTNVINVNAINLGTGTRDAGVMKFATGATGSVTIRNQAGTGRISTLTLGPTSTQATAYTTASVFDTTGHSADIAITTLQTSVGAKAANNTNDVKFDAGTLDIRTVNMAVAKGAGTSVNKITIGGGTVLLGGSAAFGDLGTGAVTLATAGTGELAVNGGTVTSSVDILRGTATAGSEAILTLGGGTLDLTNHSIGTAANPVNTINLQSGGLRNVVQINGGTPVLSKTTAGTLLLGGTNTFTNHLNVAAGTLQAGSTTGLGLGTTFSTATVSGTTVATGAALDLNGSADVNEVITLNGTGIGGDGALVNSNASTPASVASGLVSVGLATPTGAASSTVTVSGGSPTTPATATANLSLTPSTFTLATKGAGYSVVATATISGGSPTTAGTVTSLMGLTAASITIGANSGYTVEPTITFNTPTGGIAATGHFVNTGGVLSLVMDTPGQGYTAAPVVTLTGGTTSGTAVTATGTFTNLIVQAISVTGGSGYTSVPASLVFSGTATTQATATVNPNSLLVNSVTITNPGAGYTSVPTLTNGTAVLTPGVSGIVLASDSSIGGAGNITVNGIVSESGGARALTKVGANTLTLATTNTYTGATTVNAGTLRVDGSIAASSGVTVAGSATFTAGATQVVKALDLSAATSNATIAAGAIRVLSVGDNTTASPLTLTGGKMDLNTSALIVDFTAGNEAANLTLVKNAIIAGRNAGAWNGTTGITSTAAAAASSVYGVGYAPGTVATAAIAGVTPDATSLVARYTRLGDANLDGAVNFFDLTALAAAYGAAGEWYNGDFDYSGDVNFFDLTALAANYGTGLPSEPIPGATPDFSADLAAAFASVPEPGAISLLGLAALALLKRRNNRKAA